MPITQASQGLVIPDLYRRTFSNNFEMVASQSTSRFAECAIVSTFDGKEYVYQDIDETSFKQKTERMARTVAGEMSFSRRKITKKSFYDHKVFDRDDKTLLAQLSEPKSELVTQFKKAWAKLWDEQFIAALDGTVYGGSGEELVTPITFDSAHNAVAVDYVATGSETNSGLTMEKLQRARVILEEQEYCSEGEDADCEVYCGMSPKMKNDLFEQAKAQKTSPYSAMVVDWYNDPQNKRLFGFRVKIQNRLPINSSDIENCFVWSKEAMRISSDQVETVISNRPDLSHATQVSAYGKIGAMRRWENGVVRIACDRSP